MSLSKLIRRLRGQDDPRGQRFVAVIECILDQNVRDAGAARFPAMNFEVLKLCHQHHVGILQMPCPEIDALGPERRRPPGQSLRAALETPESQHRCSELAREVTNRIGNRIARGDRLLAIVGGNPRSPGCAVHCSPDGLAPESGVFLKALQVELGRRGREVPFLPMRDGDPRLLADDLEELRRALAAS